MKHLYTYSSFPKHCLRSIFLKPKKIVKMQMSGFWLTGIHCDGFYQSAFSPVFSITVMITKA